MAQENVGLKNVYEGMEGYVEATHWAKPYFSNHHHENHSPADSKMLGHVNCGYLSTPGRPPTLEALKQHAQSLTYLISTIVPGQLGAEIDNENQTFTIEGNTGTFEKSDAYDFLNNLQIPYDNIDKAHRKPLNSLVNLVKRNSDERGVEFHCPLTELEVKNIENYSQEPTRPFQTHMTLLMHANECLERLDHEYSALGGLLAILPTDRENVVEEPDLPKAKSTLVGQWLLYTQHLVGRMHELEIAYANSLDLLASEAIVPAQQMSMYGPDGRSGREIVFPQDRWILANAGEDVFNFIHRMLDNKESFSNGQDSAWIKQGVVGKYMYSDPLEIVEEGSRLRGIVHVDVSTRFYRLKGSGHGPIFVLPAFADRPNTEYTKQMENRPSVVVLPTPTAPEQQTAWEKSHKGLEKDNAQQAVKRATLTRENVNLKTANKTLEEEVKRLGHLNKIYEESYGSDGKALRERIATAESKANDTQTQYDEVLGDRNNLRRELNMYKERVAQEQRAPPPDIKQTGADNFEMNARAYQQYLHRSSAVLAARPEVTRAKATLEALAKDGHLDISAFKWMDIIANCA
ncbi:hypothetical protein F5Y13DRAFT_203611 [Hypoxylon sp. FL1857]|nr:hypothetical protein F5Y13DRAFT_203611 [Hypoxylon sp. FL1857]